MSKDTLQLPKTAFSMKANLPLKSQKFWKSGKKIKFLKNLEKVRKVKKNLFYMTGHHMQMDIYIWELLLIKF